MTFLYAVPFIVLVMVSAVELDCTLYGIKKPSDYILDWIDNTFGRK